MKYTGAFPAGQWQHWMAPAPEPDGCQHRLQRRPIAIEVRGGRRLRSRRRRRTRHCTLQVFQLSTLFFLWAMKYFGTFPGGAFDRMEPPESAADNVDAFLSTTVWSPEAALVVPIRQLWTRAVGWARFQGSPFRANRDCFWALGFDPASA